MTASAVKWLVLSTALSKTTKTNVSWDASEAYLQSWMGVVEPGVIAGQVQLNMKITSVHGLICFRSCGHIQLQHP